MSLVKGQRVEFKGKDTVRLGHVYKVSAAGISLILDDWMVSKPVPARQVSASSAPVPEGAPGHRIWAKGNRIEFETDDKRVIHATVVSGDFVKVKAVEDGGRNEYVVGAKGVRPSSKVLPTPAPSVMDDWGVKSYKGVAALSEETEAFTADITYKGKPVLKASNRGHGGCNSYHGPADVQRRFEADAKAWFNEANVEHLTEATDEFVSWYATLRPFAVDAMQHLQDFDRDIGSAIHMPPNL